MSTNVQFIYSSTISLCKLANGIIFMQWQSVDETEYFRVYSLLCCMFYGAEHISNNMDSTFKLF